MKKRTKMNMMKWIPALVVVAGLEACDSYPK